VLPLSLSGSLTSCSASLWPFIEILRSLVTAWCFASVVSAGWVLYLRKSGVFFFLVLILTAAQNVLATIWPLIKILRSLVRNTNKSRPNSNNYWSSHIKHKYTSPELVRVRTVFPSLLQHWWLSNRKDIRPTKRPVLLMELLPKRKSDDPGSPSKMATKNYCVEITEPSLDYKKNTELCELLVRFLKIFDH